MTVLLTGEGGESGYVDYVLSVPSDNTPRIQEAHILIGHILCELIEEGLYVAALP
jgi:D-sedoheptulose 7-phosphate isomerase